MYILYIIRIIESFSFVFAILNFAFHFIIGADYSGPLFALSSVITFLCCFLKMKNKKLYYIPVLIIMLNLIFDHSVSSFFFTAVVMIFNFYFIKKDIFKLDYRMLIDEFRAGFAAVIIIFLFALVTRSTAAFGRVSAPFLIVYLISSVTLLRSLRNSEFTEKRKFVNTSNFAYCTLVILISFILGIEQVRTGIFNMIAAIYFKIIDILVFLLSHVFAFVGYFLEYFFEFLKKLLLQKGSSKAFDSFRNSTSNDSENPFKNHISKVLVDSAGFHIIMEILLIAFILYLFYRMFTKRIHSAKYEEQFTESKDFILFHKSGSKKSLRRFLKPAAYRDYVRYYYSKFLKLAEKYNTGITKSDTTLDINKKARTNFSKDALDDMRSIYIKARYSSTDVGNDDVNRIRKNYKKLKN